MEFGKNIKKLRISNGINQNDLAEALGYKSKSSIARIENGTRDIPVSKLIEFAEYFGVDVSVIVGNNKTNEIDLTNKRELLKIMIDNLDSEKIEALIKFINSFK